MLYIANLIIKFETNKQTLSIFQTSSSCHLPKLQSANVFKLFLVCSNAIEALGSCTVADSVEFFVRGLAQCRAWSFAVDGVYHHFRGAYLSHGCEPRLNESVAGVGHVAPEVVSSVHEDGLNDDVTIERLHLLDYPLHVVSRRYGAVYIIYIYLNSATL